MQIWTDETGYSPVTEEEVRSAIRGDSGASAETSSQTVRFEHNGEIYNVPAGRADEFLRDYPNAFQR